MSTPHISAAEGAFADVCLLPGDPLRARHAARRFLDDPVLVTAVRNMEGYTGEYRGRRISVMGTGMGIPSASIYAIFIWIIPTAMVATKYSRHNSISHFGKYLDSTPIIVHMHNITIADTSHSCIVFIYPNFMSVHFS